MAKLIKKKAENLPAMTLEQEVRILRARVDELERQLKSRPVLRLESQPFDLPRGLFDAASMFKGPR